MMGVEHMNGKEAVSRNIAILLLIVGIVCAGLIGAVTNYTAIINSKDSQIQALAEQNNRLQQWLDGNLSELNTLKTQLTELQIQVTSLNQERNQLQMWLDGNKTLLNQTLIQLQENITYYYSQISSLNSQITDLQNQIATLQNEINSLNMQMATLEIEYQAYVSAYQSLRDTVNQRWNQINVEPFITPLDPAVENIVQSVTGGWSNSSDWNEYWNDVKAMYNWVVNNVEYRYDSLFPMLPDNPSEELCFWNEMWQFPNETLNLRKGDCEDMAILLCSMLRCYSNTQYIAEVILIVSSTAGHAAVQVPVSGYKLVILDPAGGYYSHDLSGNITFNDITTEINNWLSYWKPYMGNDVHVERVFSDYIDRAFTSTSEYIAWMYNRPL
jgi:cell division protein FtsB